MYDIQKIIVLIFDQQSILWQALHFNARLVYPFYETEASLRPTRYERSTTTNNTAFWYIMLYLHINKS